MEISLESLIANNLTNNEITINKLISIINRQIDYKFTDAFSSKAFSIFCKMLKNITNHKFNNLLIYNVDLSNIKFNNCDFTDTEFYNCDFTNTVFIDCYINKIADCNIKNIFFRNCKFKLFNNLLNSNLDLIIFGREHFKKNIILYDKNAYTYYYISYKLNANIIYDRLFISYNDVYGFIQDINDYILIKLNIINGVYSSYDEILKISDINLYLKYNVLTINKNVFLLWKYRDKKIILIDVENKTHKFIIASCMLYDAKPFYLDLSCDDVVYFVSHMITYFELYKYNYKTEEYSYIKNIDRYKYYVTCYEDSYVYSNGKLFIKAKSSDFENVSIEKYDIFVNKVIKLGDVSYFDKEFYINEDNKILVNYDTHIHEKKILEKCTHICNKHKCK